MDISKIKGILFDFDNTLMDRQLAAYNLYADLIEKHIPFERGSFEFECVLQDIMVWEQWGNSPKEQVFEALCKKYKLDEKLIVELHEGFMNALGSHAVLYDDTVNVLKKLKEKYQVGIVTNGRVDVQSGKFNTTKILDHVDFALISGDYKAKPHPMMYEEALKKMNLQAEEVVFVGDLFQTDIIGAYRVGMNPIWIMSDTSRPCSIDIIIIRKIAEILDIL